ncbi:MAG: phosphoribosylaminoimidazolesuccinocarboxamide synthase [Pontimonas sp.]
MDALSDWTLAYQGKVRDVYIPQGASTIADSPHLLIVATDRVSAFDVVLSPDIPGKGAILTEISGWWMGQLSDIPNHLLDIAPPHEVRARAVVARSLSMLPVECVVRGYLVGSGWKEYQASRSVCGISLPEGLGEGDRLPEPLFTPATKAAVGDHDENISFDQVRELLGREQAEQLKAWSLDIYSRASAIALERGLILADTKFEFGHDRESGELRLGDEALTPDSSRYWDADAYAKGGPDRLDSFDKQIIRNWLADHWDKTGTPPALPKDIVEKTTARYQELKRRLMGAA